ncbi:MAG: hypothetical protein AAGA41_13245, partial [Pseudomonadota bacterium]
QAPDAIKVCSCCDRSLQAVDCVRAISGIGTMIAGKIAKEFYGKASAYMKIFEANRGIIENPDRIYPGQTIRIPRD